MLLVAGFAVAVGVLPQSVSVLGQGDEPPDAAFHSQVLAPGWNLVAALADAPIDAASGGIERGLESLYNWDATADAFRFFGVTAPTFVNTLDMVRGGEGIWVRMQEDGVWRQPMTRAARTIALEEGFNLVGWTGPTMDVADAIAAIAADVDLIATFDATTQTSLLYGPTRLSFLNDDITLRFGDGLWVRATRPVMWDPACRTARPHPERALHPPNRRS